MVTSEMFACALTEAGKVMLFSVLLSCSTPVVFTSTTTSYSYTALGAVKKEGDVSSTSAQTNW